MKGFWTACPQHANHMAGMSQGVSCQQAHLTGMPVTSLRICAASGHDMRSRTTGTVLPAYLAGSANTTEAPHTFQIWTRRMLRLTHILAHTKPMSRGRRSEENGFLSANVVLQSSAPV